MGLLRITLLPFYLSFLRSNGVDQIRSFVVGLFFVSLPLCIFCTKKKMKNPCPLSARFERTIKLFLSFSLFVKKSGESRSLFMLVRYRCVYVFQALIFSLSLSLSKFYLRFLKKRPSKKKQTKVKTNFGYFFFVFQHSNFIHEGKTTYSIISGASKNWC